MNCLQEKRELFAGGARIIGRSGVNYLQERRELFAGEA